ncbi:MAG: DnaJ C-terminal domain-containing protein [Chloroflexota bacterium]
MSEVGPPNRNLYDLLGIAPNADAQEVRRAYRSLARHLHPDLNRASDAAHRFNQVTHAYGVLSDPTRRRLYDEGRRNRGGAPMRSSLATKPGVSRGVLRGADVSASTVVSLREAVFGVEVEVDAVRREVCVECVGMGIARGGASVRCVVCNGTGGTRSPGDECRTCNGSGVVGEPPCSPCHGSGRRVGQLSLTVKIPPGVEDGQVIRLKGDGDAGPRNGPRGDLLLRVSVEPDPVLRRNGIDIMMDLPLGTAEARDGCHVEVPTLRGPKRIRVQQGTGDRAVVRLPGAGIRLPGSWHKGDQFVIVRVYDDINRMDLHDDHED